jgi:Zn-dependent peptidase ImmA (M78 family)/transcriptional regulator with XRE-family HTH domain
MEHTLQKIDPRILGEKLKSARTDRRLTQNDAADHLGVARTTLVAIEKGDRRITAKELVMLASLYGRPLSDWLSEKPASVPLVPQFRMPPRELNLGESEIRDAVSKLESLARDYAGLEGRTALPLVRRHPVPYSYEGPGITPEMRGEEVAAEERTRLGLGDGPIHDLRSVLEESVGLRVFYLDLPSVIGGIYAYSEDLGGCIAINRLHPAPRGVWSLAHEFGHFLSTRHAADVSLWNGAPWGRAAAEKFADSFAKNFLMPRTGVNRLLSEMVSAHGKGVTAADVLTLAHQFRVSAEAIFRRLEELKRLPAGTWDSLRGNRPDKARTTLGLPLTAREPVPGDHVAHRRALNGLPLTAREPVLPFRYRMMARNAYDAADSDMTESELAALLRMDRVAVRDELEVLRSQADGQGDDGFERIDLDPNQLLLAV